VCLENVNRLYLRHRTTSCDTSIHLMTRRTCRQPKTLPVCIKKNQSSHTLNTSHHPSSLLPCGQTFTQRSQRCCKQSRRITNLVTASLLRATDFSIYLSGQWIHPLGAWHTGSAKTIN